LHRKTPKCPRGVTWHPGLFGVRPEGGAAFRSVHGCGEPLRTTGRRILPASANRADAPSFP
jgi:hypothetical protein